MNNMNLIPVYPEIFLLIATSAILLIDMFLPESKRVITYLLSLAALAIVAALYFATKISHVWLFWAAFILTRPLGATVGDFLDKPLGQGGLELSRGVATLVLAIAIGAMILLIPQHSGRNAIRKKQAKA